MSRSVTVSLPPGRRLATVVMTALLGLLIIVGGIRLGIWLIDPGPVRSLTAGAALHEIQVSRGIIIGRIRADEGGFLRVAGAAELREVAATETTPGRFVVRLLSTEPTYVDGDLLIAHHDILTVGNVAADSDLERAYRQARGDLPLVGSPTPAPSGSPDSP